MLILPYNSLLMEQFRDQCSVEHTLGNIAPQLPRAKLHINHTIFRNPISLALATTRPDVTSGVRIHSLIKTHADTPHETGHQTLDGALQGTGQNPVGRRKPRAERNICVLKLFSSSEALALLGSV